jgi:hypothetical protein
MIEVRWGASRSETKVPAQMQVQFSVLLDKIVRIRMQLEQYSCKVKVHSAQQKVNLTTSSRSCDRLHENN